MPEPLLVKPTEAAEMLRISRARVYELIASGKVPSVRVGRFTRIPLAALREWVRVHSEDSPIRTAD